MYTGLYTLSEETTANVAWLCEIDEPTEAFRALVDACIAIVASVIGWGHVTPDNVYLAIAQAQGQGIGLWDQSLNYDDPAVLKQDEIVKALSPLVDDSGSGALNDCARMIQDESEEA